MAFIAAVPFIGAADSRAQTRQSSAHGSLSLGLCGPTYYLGFCPFLNWWKTASQLEIARRAGGTPSGRAVWDAGIYLDPDTGEVVTPAPVDLLSFNRIFFTPPSAYQVAAGCNYSGEPWVAEWDGSGSGFINFLTAGGSQTKINSNKIIFRMGVNPGNTQLKLTLTDRSDPPRNIRIYQSRYASNVAAGEKFNPDWLAEIKKFGTLRLMGWQSTNNSEVSDFSQLAGQDYTWWCKQLSNSSATGPKGDIHPSVICELANLTGCNIHVCIPVKATDAFVSEFASYCKNNTRAEVTYELSNECWNFGFNQAHYCSMQGERIWPADGARYLKWYGYRAAQVMKLVRDVYDDGSRWRGAINSQTAWDAPARQILAGIAYWKSSTGSPLNVRDLFKGLYVTGYFGDVQQARPIARIANSNPAVVYSTKHGYENGQRVKLFIQKGMTELNNTFAIVGNTTADTYELQGVNSTGYSASASGNNYSVKALIFDIMDKSNAKFIADPVRYPTKYTYFSQQLATSLLTGACSEGFTTNSSVAKLRSTYWPALKTIATAYGLELRQYEGGCHFVGDAYMTGYGGEPQFTDYLLNFGHSTELAADYAASYVAFKDVGGLYPSKFVEGGQTSRYGTWAGIRFWPAVANGNTKDTDNPVWRAVLEANAGG